MAIDFFAGQTLTAADLNALVPLEATLSSDQSITSSTTIVDQADLTIAVEANAVYKVEGLLIATSAANAAGDVQYRFSYPTGAVLTVTGPGPHNALASGSQADGEWFYVLLDGASPAPNLPYGASTAGAAAIINGKLTVSGTAGNLVLGFAQLASNVNATVLKGGSYIRLTRTS